MRPDTHGNVRTVVVQVRDRRKAVREGSMRCKAGLTEMVVAVQRLVVILPREESWNQGLALDSEKSS